MKKILSIGSIVIIIIIILMSYDSVISYDSKMNCNKVSPLFQMRVDKYKHGENVKSLESYYLGKENKISLHFPYRIDFREILEEYKDILNKECNNLDFNILKILIQDFENTNFEGEPPTVFCPPPTLEARPLCLIPLIIYYFILFILYSI